MNILVAAGGTGGHLFPTLAVVEQLRKLSVGSIGFTFIGNPDKIESSVVPNLGYDFRTIKISGFAGLSLKSFALPFKILSSIIKCSKILKERKYSALIAAGAYLSYPPAIAAYWAGVPIFLIESNVYPGKTIKMLSGKARLIFTSYTESEKYFKPAVRQRLKPFGNPIRNFLLNPPAKSAAIRNFGFEPGNPFLLIFGGSLGAISINKAVENSLSELSGMNINVLWQTGKNYKAPESLPANIKALEFIEDMASAYTAADLVVCRSGGTTVAELAAAGKPSILVPFPGAANNEQESNAMVLVNRGAAMMVRNSDIGAQFLTNVGSIINNNELLKDMAATAASLGKPDAAEKAARAIMEAIGGKIIN